MIDKKVMETLKENIGKRITVRYVWYGRLYTDREVLGKVTNFVNIVTEHSGTPFVGYGCAIQTISNEDGEILYHNSLILDNYDLRRDEEIDAMIYSSFGKKIATKHRQKRDVADRKWKAREAQLNKKARTKTSEFIKEGEGLVKPELRDEWKKFVSNNTEDFYFANIIEASLSIMQALSGKKPLQEVEATIDCLSATNFQMGCIAQTVSYFHPQGEKFRRFWNRQYTSEDIKGVVNPAIIILKPR